MDRSTVLSPQSSVLSPQSSVLSPQAIPAHDGQQVLPHGGARLPPWLPPALPLGLLPSLGVLQAVTVQEDSQGGGGSHPPKVSHCELPPDNLPQPDQTPSITPQEAINEMQRQDISKNVSLETIKVTQAHNRKGGEQL